MPELPEVESLRRGLARLVVGQRIKRVIVNKPKLVSGKGNIRTASARKVREFVRGLTGARFARVERKAKNLLFYLDSGLRRNDKYKVLLVHLKMSGQFIYREHGKNLVIGGHPIEIAEKQLPNKHTHIIFELTRPSTSLRAGGTLYYNDTRMFGYLLYYPNQVAFAKENHFAKIGVEPMSPAFTVDYLYRALKTKNSKLKTTLMNQEIVTGLGNIYADEAAFEAGVRPTRAASSLTRAEVTNLRAAIKRILKRAITLGGSSVATYRLLDDSRGNYAREHKVYGKAGEKCGACATALKKILINSRTTVYCPKCQK